jgi:hypothetical protein
MIEGFIEKVIDWLVHVAAMGYTLNLLLLLACGFIGWIIAYYHILMGAKRFKIIEMPMIVAAANLSWEFTWSFLYIGDLGHPFQWGCRVWFVLDLFINYYVFVYGRKLSDKPVIGNNWFRIWAFSLIVWLAVVYFMAKDNVDNPLGVVSALLINVVMSGLYIYQLLNYPEYRGKGFSIKAAWAKMFGTGFISIASLFLWPENEWLLTMCLTTVILDIAYISLFYKYKPQLQTL